MKKRLMATLAACLVLMLSTTVFAAVSPADEDGYTAVRAAAVGDISTAGTTAVDANGNTVGITVRPVKKIGQIVSEQTATTAAKEAVSNGTVALSLSEGQTAEASVLGVVEVSAPNGTTFPVTITLPVSSVSAGDSVILLHYVNGNWETVIPTVVGDGYVRAVFYSFSPIAVVLVEAAEDSAVTVADDEKDETDSKSTSVKKNTTTGTSKKSSGNSGSGKSASGKSAKTSTASAKATSNRDLRSPKTGEPVTALPIAAGALALGIGLCVIRMKRI